MFFNLFFILQLVLPKLNPASKNSNPDYKNTNLATNNSNLDYNNTNEKRKKKKNIDQTQTQTHITTTQMKKEKEKKEIEIKKFLHVLQLVLHFIAYSFQIKPSIQELKPITRTPKKRKENYHLSLFH